MEGRADPTNKCLDAILYSHGAAARDMLRITFNQVLEKEREQNIHNQAMSYNNSNSQRAIKG